MHCNETRAGDLFGQIEGLVTQIEGGLQARLAGTANLETLDLIEIMSKKLRPPMESVAALSDRILEGPLNVAQRRDAEILSHSMHRILSALTEVRHFGTLQTGDADFAVDTFDFQAVVRETASVLQACAAARGLGSSVEMAANCPRYIVGDAMRIRQVLMALMETSIQSTAEGSIRLYVSVNDAVSPLTVRFDITDTSAGFTPEQLAALFQPSADAALSDGGLRLPIAQRIAEAMGGGLACESAVGQGALYWFTFKALVSGEEPEASIPAGDAANATGNEDSAKPVTDHPLQLDVADVVVPEAEGADSIRVGRSVAKMLATPAPYPTAQAAPEGRKDGTPGPQSKTAAKPTNGGPLTGHALLIEDNRINRGLIGVYLDEFGLTFDVAETGSAALMCLHERSYDVVLMDTVLPDYRGAQLAQRIRSQESASAHVPIVALTTPSDTEDEETYVKAGVNASVDKPIQGRKLYKTLVPLMPKEPKEKDSGEDADDEWTPVY